MTNGIVGVYGFGNSSNLEFNNAQHIFKKNDLVISARDASCMAERNGIVVAFEGKIFNSEPPSGGSPANTLIDLYLQHGVKFVETLDAKASIFLVDTRKKILILIRDRLGLKPIYYAKARNSIAFSSTQKDLIHFYSIDPVIDKTALYLYLYYGYVPSPVSLVRGISKVPAATCCIFDNMREEQRGYWTPSFSLKQSVSIGDAIHALEREIQSSISKVVGRKTQVGLLLSGGLDSTTILALARQQGLAVSTYTVSVGDNIHDESRVAETIADTFKTSHRTIPLKDADIQKFAGDIAHIFDEPFSDPSLIPTSFLYSQIKDELVLAGDGGDELLGGYPKYYAHSYAERYRRIPKPVRRLFLDRIVMYAGVRRGITMAKVQNFVQDVDLPLPVRNQEWVCQFHRKELGEMLSMDDPDILFSIPTTYANSFDGSNPSEKAMFVDMKLNLVDQYNMKVDASSRFSGLDVECPLLDKRLFEFAASLPVTYKIQRSTTKVILRKLDEKYIPASIINRPKTGFGIPLDDIVRTTLHDQLHETLNSSSLITKSGIHNSGAIMSLLTNLDKKQNNAKKIWTVFALLKWIQERESK